MTSSQLPNITYHSKVPEQECNPLVNGWKNMDEKICNLLLLNGWKDMDDKICNPLLLNGWKLIFNVHACIKKI